MGRGYPANSDNSVANWVNPDPHTGNPAPLPLAMTSGHKYEVRVVLTNTQATAATTGKKPIIAMKCA
jgi:hypothetical protein